jgi:hypothetical protein
MTLRYLWGGLSTFYADESDDKFIYTIACVAIPTLEKPSLISRTLAISWDRYLAGAKAWRKDLRERFGVPASKELKGSSIATGSPVPQSLCVSPYGIQIGWMVRWEAY